MKALYFSEPGGVDKLQFGEVERPEPQPDEVLVRVKACALNHLDLWVLRGWPGQKLKLPHIGGADIAGVVEEVGSAVQNWKAGQRVAVNPGYLIGEDEWTKRGDESASPFYRIFGEGRPGGFAEYVTVPAQNLVELPPAIGFTAGAAPLLVGLTSWRMLKKRAQLQAGETVLIVGAGGGVNSFAIQLARFFGARVIALTSSEAKEQKARELGAEIVINYRRHADWSREVRRITDNRGVDVVVDNVGAATMLQSIHSVRRGGRIVTVGNTSGPSVALDNRLIFTKQISIIGSTMGSAQDFQNVTHCIWSGQIAVAIDRELPLAQGQEGYRVLEKGEQFGKVVLVP